MWIWSGAVAFACIPLMAILMRFLKIEHVLAIIIPMIVISSLISIACWADYMLDVNS